MKNKLFAVAAALTAAVTSFAAQAAEELRVGTHPTFAPFEFMDTLFSGTIDIAASGITITEERKKKVDFCDPYYQAGQGLLVRTESSGTYKDLKSLEGKVVAVQIGTTGADLAKTIKGAEIKAFNTGAEAFMDLKMRGSEAVITDRPVIGYFMVKNPKAAKGLTLQKTRLDAEYFGFAVKKGNKAVATKVNDALRSMKSDGTYQKLYQKWFGAQ